MSVGELVAYTSFPWEKMYGSVDPLDLVLGHQLRVYIKFDTGRYVARTKSWIAAAFEGKLFSTQQDALLGNLRQKSLPEWLQGVWESDLRFLALDDKSIAEIRSTGDCTIKVFKSGGLKPAVQTTAGSTVGAQVTGDQMLWYEAVPFAECFLVERSRMVEYEMPRGLFNEIESLDRHAVQVRIGRESLFFEKAQLECVGKEDSDYPPEDGKVRPLAIIWLYKLSVALNSGLIQPQVVDKKKKMTQGYVEIEKWLEGNAPKSVVKGALKKTAKTIASKDYNRSKNFDAQGLEKYPGSERVPVDNLSLPVRFTLAITEWWIGLSKQRQLMPDLLCELGAAGFDKTAALDLAGMISGKPFPRDKRDQFWMLAQKALKRRERKKLGERKSRMILRKSSVNGQLDHAATDCVDE